MPLLRFQNLYEAHNRQIDDHEKHKALEAPTLSLDSLEITRAEKSSQPSQDEPKLTWETNTPFGKLTVSDATVGQVGRSLKTVVANASCRVDAYKESLGIPTFRKEEADLLVQSGVLEGDQWMRAPENQLVRFKQSPYAVYGSLTFTAPMETYDLIRKSSAFNSLMALVAIGSIQGPVERTVELVVAGALDGIFEDDSDLGRPYIEKGLRRALLRTHAAERTNKQSNFFDNFLLQRLEEVPAPIRDLCAKSEEDVRTLEIDDSQLGAIAEWAFASTNPRTLVLFNKVEVLASAVVSSFFKSRRLAVVDCSTNKHQLFDSGGNSNEVPGLAIYCGGDAQQAIRILHRINWLQPVMRAESKRVPRSSPYLALSCSIETSLKLCTAFLQSVGVKDDDANHLVNALKKDAVEQFAREVRVVAEEQDSWSFTSQENVQYSYEYLAPCLAYDWKFWLGLDNVDVQQIILNQPHSGTIDFGSSTYYGYTAKALGDRPAIKELHSRFMRSIPAGTHLQDSDVSSALGEVAGLIFSFALSCVHVHDQAYMKNIKVSTGLGADLKSAYSLLRLDRPGSERTKIHRQECLGVLAQVWLDLPGAYLPHWPQSSLGISNSQGAVISAVFAETRSLEDATTKFVISTDVPDIMVGEKPVVACATTPRSMVQKRGHEVEITASTKDPYDGCWQICCITITGGQPPPLEKGNLLSNMVSIVPVCGYIACGARWWEYVDLDNAFAVMAESVPYELCSNCPERPEGLWLEQERFLERAQGGGFSCSVPKPGQKLVLPAYQNGLMQCFLCGVFRWSVRELRCCPGQCVTHGNADVLIV